jgi:recombination protein RecT
MTKKQVTDHAQKYSKSFTQPQSPWKTEFDAMAKKTTLRGLLGHWGYLSVEMLDAFTEDDRDIAEKTMDEIRNKGNMKTTGIAEAEQVNENVPSQNGQQVNAPF